MTDAIQRNAANMLAISLPFFMRATSTQAIKPVTPISDPFKESLPFMQKSGSTATMQLLA